MKCSRCGGVLRYSIEKGQLVCDHCNSNINVKDYNSNNEGEKVLMDVYHCQSCGANLSAPQEQIVAYCMYCGGQSTLLQKAVAMNRPSKIIPFKCTREKVKENYIETLNTMYFVPKELKEAEFLEGFRGIYIPYWKTSGEADKQQVDFKGIKSYYSDGYDYIEHYDYSVDFGGVSDGGYYDASEAFDDTVAAEIAPFNSEKIRPFREGYLAGFYADMATVGVEVYDSQVVDTLVDDSYETISSRVDGISVDKKKIEREVRWKKVAPQMALFPVWFLTFRKNKRVAYAVMNGETGKMTMDVPVDYSRFFLNAVIATLVLFLILNLFDGFILPINVAGYTSVFLYISSLLLKGELRNIRIRENHIYDWGDKHSKAKKELPGKNKAASGLSVVLKILAVLTLVANFFNMLEEGTVDGLSTVLAMVMAFQLYITVKAIRELAGVKNKAAIIPIIISLVIQFAAFEITDISRQHDYWYFGIAIACLAGMVLNCITSIFYMNYLTTRPVPNFFTREGAGNEK